MDITFYDDLTSVSDNIESKELVESKPIDMSIYESHRSLTAPDVSLKQFAYTGHDSNSVIGDQALKKIVRAQGLLGREFVESIKLR